MANEATTTAPTGAAQDSGNSAGSQSGASTTQVDPKVTTSTGDANTSENESDDEYDGLTAKELKRLLSETQIGKKSLDSELAEIKGKLEEKERKERTDLENFKADNEKLQNENNELKAALETTAIVNSILNNKKFTFHDATDVLNNLKRTELTIDAKTGKVEGIDLELARVAKDKPFLVVRSAKDESNNQDQNNGSSPKQNQKTNSGGPTGFQPGQGGSSGNVVQEQRSSLLNKYPILANR